MLSTVSPRCGATNASAYTHHAWPIRRCSTAPVSTSHTSTNLSCPPDAMRCDVEDHAQQYTSPAWPLSVTYAPTLCAARSVEISVSSAPSTRTTRVSSGLNATLHSRTERSRAPSCAATASGVVCVRTGL